METLEVKAKDFLVKWVNAPDNSSIKWQVKTLKRSINFAIYQKFENMSGVDVSVSEQAGSRPGIESYWQGSCSDEIISTVGSTRRLRSGSVTSVNAISRSNTFKTRSRSSTFSSNLSNSGLKLVKDYHKLVPDELVKGVFNVDKGGIFAFVFDNTFSKTIGKKVFFSTKLTGEEMSTQRNGSPKSLRDMFSESDESSYFPDDTKSNIMWPKDGELMQGLLSKKRKKMQGFTKRFFILNFKHGTLSYFKSNDNKLRGQMPIPESIVSACSKTRQIFIDSGMEVWNLRALNEKDFKAWVDAFSVVKKRSTLFSENTCALSETESPATAQLRDVERKVNNLISELSTMSIESIKHDLRNISTNVSVLLQQSVSSDAASMFSDAEFFDAEDQLDITNFGVVLMTDTFQAKQTRSDEESTGDMNSESSSSSSEVESLPASTAAETINVSDTRDDASNLYPLPLDPIERDCDIPVCDHSPPSMLSLVRKNVGKDLSSLSMPVNVNEPITILQRYAEILEYSDMVDNALQGDCQNDSGELILRIGAFSVSYLSAMRMKIRSSRKPFNPLLGETYELVREDKGFRMLCEKVSHRPPVFAMFAESENWTLSFNPSPSQKFWGKTSEIYTSGTVKLTIKESGEVFSWNQPTCIVKNIIAGEKFTEPSTSITVKSSSGQRAVVEFAKGGMFSGRSEDLTIKAFDASKTPLPYVVSGKWTESMTLKTCSTEKSIWTAGELLPQSERKFGFTAFTGTLNKITSIEEGKLPPTDSRFRPDMQVYEAGNVVEAELLKQKVEEGQRSRRSDLEKLGKEYTPQFFKHVGASPDMPDSGEWVYKTGNLSYWERRKAQNWSDLTKLW